MSETDRPARFHALDRVRASAMLLGVLFHSLMFRVNLESTGPENIVRGADRYLEAWLHHFRMPLFFLIAGFFGRMMLAKYGLGSYLRKRWTRIGIPMVVGMFTFVPAFLLTEEALTSSPAVEPGGSGELGDAGSPTARPAGVEDEDAGLDTPGEMEPPAGWSGELFGPSSRFFRLDHLWFLWYLLGFVTVAPAISGMLAWTLARTFPSVVNDFGPRLFRSGLAPALLGVVVAPTLMIGPEASGWSLGHPGSIYRSFPDFLLHLDPEMGFFLAFFLAGWWLHRERDSLGSLARAWPANLVVGTAALVAATLLGRSFREETDLAFYPAIHWAGCTLYGLASAATSFAILGFFQRHLDRPSVAWRYLADTALWVYLVHQPLVLVGLALLIPYRLPWWILTPAVAILATAAALLIYELVVRRTFLVRLFGPAAPRPAVIARF